MPRVTQLLVIHCCYYPNMDCSGLAHIIVSEVHQVFLPQLIGVPTFDICFVSRRRSHVCVA